MDLKPEMGRAVAASVARPPPSPSAGRRTEKKPATPEQPERERRKGNGKTGWGGLLGDPVLGLWRPKSQLIWRGGRAPVKFRAASLAL